ncbi:hypothetical protein V7S43_005043 [Phytophthora oleae]|uniref:Uncharacterized protein n=1 Tax=Phytophthora oleae TaxID=2107226 RepID=A0ABD3FTV8_9STRA
MDRSSSWTNAGRNADYIPPSRVAKMTVPSPRPPPGSTAEAVATARRAEYGTGGSILPVLPSASPNASKRSSWTTPRSPSSGTLEDEFYQPISDAVTSPPRRAEMAAAKRAEPVRHRVSDGLFASETEQAQLAHMEQMYGTINLLNAELENERRNRAALEAAARPATYSSTTEYSSLEDTVGEFDDLSTGFLVSQTPVAPSYSPRKLRTMPSPPSQPPQTQYRVTRPPVSPRSIVKDQDQELCATLGKNAELRIRSRGMERTVEKTELELELAHKQIKMAERRAESREEKLRALLKEKLNWQKEQKATRAQVVEEKMRQVDLFREVEAAKRHFAAELEAVEQELQAVQGENTQLRTHAAEMKAQMNFQARKMEDMVRQAQDEKARFVSMIEDTRHRFREWKEGEAEALATAHDQAVRNLKTEYELKMERHQDEKQKLRDKVNDLEVSMRLLQKDRALSPLELSLRKTAILGSKVNTGIVEVEHIETQSRILELENLLAHSQQYQTRQESIIKLSEATISRLMQEREVTALENLSLHPFGVEPQRSEDLSYNAQLTGYVVAASSPTRRVTPPGTPTRSHQSPVKSNEPPIIRSPRSRSHTPRRADLEASIAQAAQADSTTKPTANKEDTEPSSREQKLMDELAQLKKALIEAQTKAEAQSNTLDTEESKCAGLDLVQIPATPLGVGTVEIQPTEVDATPFEAVEPSVSDVNVVDGTVETNTEREASTEIKAEVGAEGAPEAGDDKPSDLIDKVPSEPPLTEAKPCLNASEKQYSEELKEVLKKCDEVQSELDGIVTTTGDQQEVNVQEESSADADEWVDVSVMSPETQYKPDTHESEPQQDCCSSVDIEESKGDKSDAQLVDDSVPFDSEDIAESVEHSSSSPDRENESTSASDDEISQSHDEKCVGADVSSESKPSDDYELQGNEDVEADGKEMAPALMDDTKLLHVEDVGATLPEYNDTHSDEKETPCEIVDSNIEGLEIDSEEEVTTTLGTEDAECSEDLDWKQHASNVEFEDADVKENPHEDLDDDVKENTATVANDFVESVGCAVEESNATSEVEADEVPRAEEPPQTDGNLTRPGVEESIEQVEEVESPLFVADDSAESLRVDNPSAEAFVPEVKDLGALDEADTPDVSFNTVENEQKSAESPPVGIVKKEEVPDKCMDLQDIATDCADAKETKVENDLTASTESTEPVNDEVTIEATLDEAEVEVKPSLETDIPGCESEETHEVVVAENQLQQEEPVVSLFDTIAAPEKDIEVETPEASTAKVFVALVELVALSVVASLQATSYTIPLLERVEELPPPDANVVEADAIPAKVGDTLTEPEIAADVASHSMKELSLPVDNVVVGDDTLPASDTAAPVADTIIEAEVAVPRVYDATITSEAEADHFDATDVSTGGNNDVYDTSIADEEQQPLSEEQLEGDSSSAPLEIAVETNEDAVVLLTKAFAENFVKELMELLDSTSSHSQNQGINEELLAENTSSVPNTVHPSTAGDEVPGEETTVESDIPPSDSVDEVKDTLGVEAVCSNLQSATEEHSESLPLDEVTADDTLTVARDFVSAIAFEAMSSVLLSLQTENCSDYSILSREQEQEGFDSDSTRSIIESSYMSSDEQNDPNTTNRDSESLLDLSSEMPTTELEEQCNTEEEANTSRTEDAGEELPSDSGDCSEAALEIAQVIRDCVESVEREVITTLTEIGSNNAEAPVALNEFSTAELITGVACVFASQAIAEVLSRLTECANDKDSNPNSASDSENLNVSCEGDSNSVVLDGFVPVGDICSEASALEVVDTTEECNDNDAQAKNSQEEAQMLTEKVEEFDSEVVLAVNDIAEAVALGQKEAEPKGGILDSLGKAGVEVKDSQLTSTSNPEIAVATYEDVLSFEDDIAVETTDLQNDNDDGDIALVLADIIERITIGEAIDEEAEVIISSESNQDSICDSPMNDAIPHASASVPGENLDLEMAMPTAGSEGGKETADSIELVLEGIVTAIESCNRVEPEGSDDSNAPEEKEELPGNQSTASGSLPDLASADAATEDTEVPTLEGEASEDLGTTDTKMEDPNKHGDIEAYAVSSFDLPLTGVEHLVRLTLDSLVDAIAGKTNSCAAGTDAPHSIDEPSGVLSSVPDEFDSESTLESEVENIVSNLCISVDRKKAPRHDRARSVHFSCDTKDEKSDRLKQERRSVLLWKSPLDTACNKESVESSAKRRASRRRVSRRTLADLLTFPSEMSRFTSSDTTLLAYDARQEQGPIFSLLDQSILTINPNGQHIHLDESEERVASKIIGKRKTLMQELHSKNLALRQIPRFNYMPMRIKFQWSDFVVATPVRPTNTNIGEGHVVKSPVEPMRLLQKRGAKLPCGTYVVVSAFIRPLEDGNENLRVQIYDGERVEEFQFDFSEDFMKKYHLETSGLEAQSLEFLGHLEFRRDEDTIMIKLPERKAGEGGKADGDRIQSERTMVGSGDSRKREPALKPSRMTLNRQKRPASSPE